MAADIAGVLARKLLYDVVGIDRGAAVSYDNLLDNPMITQRVPAWAGSLMNRAVRLHERLGARLAVGLLVHTGPRIFRLTE